MFEIKKPSSSNKTIRMPDQLIEKLEKLAAKHDISFNQLVVQCCEYAINNMNPDNKGNNPWVWRGTRVPTVWLMQQFVGAHSVRPRLTKQQCLL